MARGGKREATPGALYSNRSDMRQTQPIQTAPGQPYGEASAQEAQQRAIPLANVAPGAAPAGATPMPMVTPGAHGSLFDPTERPDESVTHGVASGPGAGPEIMQPNLGVSAGNTSAMLNAIAQASGSGDIAVLAQHAQSLGQ